MSSILIPRVYLETVHGVVITRFADTDLIDIDVIDDVSEQLSDITEFSNILLNFRDVRFMSSSVLAVLLKFSREVAKNGGVLKLCEIAPHLLEIFAITRFDRLFEIHETEANALDSFLV
jgi:anti-sigma B factor antagonist